MKKLLLALSLFSFLGVATAGNAGGGDDKDKKKSCCTSKKGKKAECCKKDKSAEKTETPAENKK